MSPTLSFGPTLASPRARQKLVANFATISETAVSRQTLERLFAVFSTMEPSTAQPPEAYRDAQGLSQAGYCSAKQVLAAVFELAAPRNYLEIGTRRGHSLCVAARSAPAPFDAYSFDLWIPDYAGEPNPGPDLVRKELAKFGFEGRFNPMPGDSRKTVPEFFANPNNPQFFDVIYVDGDHTDEGARIDLENTVAHLAPGGFLLFDDITHPQHKSLLKVWKDFVSRHPELEDLVETRFEYGWALARRRAGTFTATSLATSSSPSSTGSNINFTPESILSRTVRQIFAERSLDQMTISEFLGSLVERLTQAQGANSLLSSAAGKPAVKKDLPNLPLGPDISERLCWCGGSLAASPHLSYGRCSKCGTLVLKSAPTDGDLKKYYSLQGYWHEHQQRDCGFPNIEQRAEADLNDRIPVWHDLLTQAKSQIGSLLEIGCAHGGFLHYCKQRGIPTVVGIEVDEQTCRFARKRFGLENVCAGLFPEVSLPLNTFDAFTGFDVIEHFSDPVAGIRSIANLLDLQGVFLFQTPCYRGETNKWAQFKPSEHIYLYDPASVRQLFERAGLEVTHVLPGYFQDDMFVIGRKKTAQMKSVPRIQLNPALTNRFVECGSGAHASEGSFRWLEKRATLKLRTDFLGASATLKFALTVGDLWCYGGSLPKTVITFEGKAIRVLSFTQDRQSFEIAIPIEPSPSPLTVVIESNVSFIPAQLDRNSNDHRKLAVRLENLGIHDAIFVEEKFSPESLSI